MTISIRLVTSPEDLALCHQVRDIVFTQEQGYPAEIEIDDIDSECLHWLAFDDETQKPVGTCRVYQKTPQIGKVGRVAVVSTVRGRGVGRDLMVALEAKMREDPAVEKLVLSSQEPRQGFYLKLGYVAHGDVYLEDGQPHVYMEKSLKAAP
ncbi:hypothetical protein BGW42_000903 [Actinomortierella wolfii]|nr:hypothetical protein BGW42_000903 [Actinomortierella wolfii]KAG0235153.1 hypothetical protein BGW41_000904 [Actinomortierella wolfii]